MTFKTWQISVCINQIQNTSSEMFKEYDKQRPKIKLSITSKPMGS